MGMRDLEEKTFFALLIAASLVFAWILWPYRGAVLWGTVFAILFEPLYRRLIRRSRSERHLCTECFARGSSFELEQLLYPQNSATGNRTPQPIARVQANC